MSPRAADAAGRKKVARVLSTLLADSYILYLKTHNYHWNVTGPMFASLHALFEQEYQELALAVDEIAERIRALGQPAPGSFSQFVRLASVKEEEGSPGAADMLRQLAADQATLIATARRVLRAAERAADEASVDLAVRRIQVHEKNAWMLHSHLE